MMEGDRMPPITVLVADQDQASRTRCLRLLRPEKDILVVGEVRSPIEAIKAGNSLRPRILLLAWSLLRDNGASLLSLFRKNSPKTSIILLPDRASEGLILDAISHGARGYLSQKVLPDFLAKAVRVVAEGEAWVPRAMVGRILDRLTRLTGNVS
jgi:DNA-binding NarL/FixJ family response regulator